LTATTLLHELAATLVSTESTRAQCLEGCLQVAIMISHADKGNIQLREGNSGELRIAAQVGFEQPFLTFFDCVRPGDPSACSTAAGLAARTTVEDVTESEIFAAQPSLRVLLDAGVRAVQATPLVSSHGTVLGMISTHFSKPHRLSERDKKFLDLLARQTADYLEREEATQALRRIEERLEPVNAA
jgi:GAF domain-containing protein